MIPYSKQSITNRDIEEVKKVLKSNYLTQGPYVSKFENVLKEKVSAKYCVAVNSATSALHLSCLALGLGKGDYLWTTSNTFVSSANCALFCGAKVDLIDIDLKDYNISIPSLKRKLIKAKKNKKLPKIIIPVHFAGRPCNMKELYKLSKTFKFKIIEDASHALGSKINGKNIGNCMYSDTCVFSFHPVKSITTGEGGCITTNDKKISENLRRLRTHGINKEKKSFINKKSPPWFFEQISLGYNYRMNDLEASLGFSQIKKLNTFIKKRNNVAKLYDKLLHKLPLIIPKRDKNIVNSYHLYPIRINTSNYEKVRFKLFNFLRKNRVNVNVHYIPIYLHPYYKKLGFKEKNYPNNNIFYKTEISIPIYPTIKKKEILYVVSLIKKFFNEK